MEPTGLDNELDVGGERKRSQAGLLHLRNFPSEPLEGWRCCLFSGEDVEGADVERKTRSSV